MPDQTTDRGTVRIVAAGLIVIALAVALGLLAVVAYAHDIPADARVTALATVGVMGSTALGAAGALLASTRNAGTPIIERPRPESPDTVLPPE